MKCQELEEVPESTGVPDSGAIPDPWTPPSIGAQDRVDLNDAPLDEKKNGFSSNH